MENYIQRYEVMLGKHEYEIWKHDQNNNGAVFADIKETMITHSLLFYIRLTL
jgi:hypothetical protein